MNQRTREDQAAWDAFVSATQQGQQHMAVMRRIIDAVDAVRAAEAAKDRDETSRDDEPQR